MVSVMAGTPKEKPKKKQPERKCVGCGVRKEKRELIRFVRSPEGEISLDKTGRKPGRGAYVCRNVECLKKASKTKALERKFEAAVDAAVFDELEKAFANLPPVEEAPDEPGV